MHILQIGAPKSGNFWFYNILKNLLTQKNIPLKSFIKQQPIHHYARQLDLSHSQQAGIDMMDVQEGQCFYRISSIIRHPIDDLPFYVDKCTHVWTHSEACPGMDTILKHFDKQIYIYRDPRDRAVSAARYAFTPYMQKYYPHNEKDIDSYLNNHFYRLIHEWIWHVSDYLLMKDKVSIYFIAYEQLLEDFEGWMHKIAAYLGVKLSPSELNKLAESVNFKTMKNKNPNHVSKGKRMQWAGFLDDRKKQHVLDVAGPLLKLLNYPLNENDIGKIPIDANSIDTKEIKSTYAKLLKQPEELII